MSCDVDRNELEISLKNIRTVQKILHLIPLGKSCTGSKSSKCVGHRISTYSQRTVIMNLLLQLY